MKFLVAYVSRRLILRLIAAASCLASLDTLGVAVIFPYLTILTSDIPAERSSMLSKAYRLTGATAHTEFVVFVSAVLAGFFLFKFVVVYLINKMKCRTSAGVTIGLSNDLFALLLKSDYGFLVERSVSEMVGIVNSETIHATLCLDAWVMIATEALFLLFVLATIVAIDVRLALALLIATALLTGVMYYGFVRRATRMGAAQTKIRLGQYRFLFGVVSALKDIKILGLEAGSEAEHRHANARYAKAIASFNLTQTLPRSIIEVLVMLALLGASVAVVLTQTNVKAAVPVIGFLAVAALRLVPSYSRIIGGYGTYHYYKPSLKMIQRLYEDLSRTQVVPQHAPRPFESVIEIRDLRFAYGDKPVLDGVSLSIRRGQSVGIVGLSGSGKTTFLDVLAGLRRAEGGEFSLDGRPVDPFGTDTLRALLGYVPQNVTLIDDTIAFNIAFDANPDPQRLRMAARAARIEEFVDSLPEGFATVVGENGVRVSGGQKQRIGIARALYHDPQLLIFDEATSSLDNITERELNLEIAALAPAKTLVIVAHRLTTVARCNEIHVFEQGKIVGSGAHASLLKTCPAYRALYQTQEHGAEIESAASHARSA